MNKIKLEDIGFYTLSDNRAKQVTNKSPLQRCEMVLTDRCNFKCTYCRGLKSDLCGDLDFELATKTIKYWIDNGLQNVRFSGGEPTLYPKLAHLIKMCADGGVKRIAISTNGASALSLYKRLIAVGVNDFSISLDACCAGVGDSMAGNIPGVWKKVVNNIIELSKLTYVTVGMVFTEDNINDCVNSVLFADQLGVADIRIIPSAQYNKALTMLSTLPSAILDRHPILKYRINNIKNGLHVRGIGESDCNKCPLVLDDMAVAGGKHFPCIIYMREQGNPIGDVSANMVTERVKWFEEHNTKTDEICKNNCLDVCVHYNNTVMAKNEFFKT